MKRYIKPPRLSTAFSESGKSAKKRFSNILNTRKKGAGAAVIVLIVMAAVIAGAMITLNRPEESRTTSEKGTLAERIYETKHSYMDEQGFADDTQTVLTTADPEEFEKTALVISNGGAENTEMLDEFLNMLSFGNYATLDVVYHLDEGGVSLIRIRTDGSVFWGGEYTEYRVSGEDSENVMNEYSPIGEFSHLKITRSYGGTMFYLVNDENLTADEINEYLLSSARWEDPPEFRLLFWLDDEQYEETTY